MREAGLIPEPKSYGPLGHLPLIDGNQPTLTLCKLAEQYGPIYRIRFPGISSLVVSGHKLVAEVCDITRFDKHVYNELQNVRAFGGDGLFTSHTTEPNWRKAHNILLPTFSKQAMKDYHPMMLDIALQLIHKWARLNPNESIDVPEDMTRLTLDTIGICGFNYRFNSFYRQDHSPFIVSMVRALNEAMQKSSRLNIQNFFMVKTKRQFQTDIDTMFTLVDKIIEERKVQGNQGENDLLSRMLNGKDPDTGEGLDDENIRYQIITFLIAGHETTSGLLSFALYFLLKHPEVLSKAYEEVDQILVSPIPTYQQVLQLKYIRMILNESLRLWPTAPGFDLFAKEDTLICGQYQLRKGDSVSVLLPQLHRDKEAWGDDADEFRPERFADPSKVPNHAYKPFGNGERACIGMQFALYEGTLVLGMILQQFKLIDHLNYQLNVKQTLTLKPGDFQMRVQLRHTNQIASMPTGAAAVMQNETEQHMSTNKKEIAPAHRAPVESARFTPMLVLYGSNLGTSEGIAHQLASQARLCGFRSEAAPLHDYVGRLPKEGAVLIVTASYNGRPPKNGASFVKWLGETRPRELEGVQYAVLGCGDRNWANTYQSVPTFIDEQLERAGGTRLALRGEADAGGEFEQQVHTWIDAMWNNVKQAFGVEENRPEDNSDQVQNAIHVQVMSRLSTLPLVRNHDAFFAVVQQNRVHHIASDKACTWQLEIALPHGITYRKGDILGVLPVNSQAIIDRVVRRFQLQADDQVLVSANEHHESAHFPRDLPISIQDLLRYCVQLEEPATPDQLRVLAAYTICPPHKRELEALLEDKSYQEQIRNKRISMLHLLETYEACELPFDKYLQLLSPLQPDYYPIDNDSERNSLQIIIDGKDAASIPGQIEYNGSTSTFLAMCDPGDDILIFIQAEKPAVQHV
ncbi:NADPH--cytochrome P450 reductase [Paenibacillus sp. E194]|uniref:cytochrome P450 n=1 Tax=Paenibacillus sp. E194 TaxID=1458845 RepID=UPI0005DFF5E8|nr:cytochrome P450 [Paenibacillus sp. E194]KJB85663.1 NADPH--cytochrome P450 reductase [Paenibacillus sp. E194]